MPTTAPYGSWSSPLTPDVLVTDAVSLSSPGSIAGRPAWVEGRPGEGGRMVLVALEAEGARRDVVPPGFSVRSALHEYGGRCWAAQGDVVVFANWDDQRLYRAEPDGPVPVTPEPPAPRSVRFADLDLSPDGRWLVAVRETHGSEVVNDLALVDLTAPGADPVALTGGHDFVAAPRLSPDGRRLAWVTWDHPDMPWDRTQLWVADMVDGRLGEPRLVAGVDEESVTEPRWSPSGRLHYASDRTGWWNLYDEAGHALAPAEAEFAGPDWQVGNAHYAFLRDGRLVATWRDAEGPHLGLVAGGEATAVEVQGVTFASLVADGDQLLAVAGSPTVAPAVCRLDARTGTVEVLRRSREPLLETAYVSVPQAITFPTSGGRTAHAFWYPPTNPDFQAPAGERPPLVVISHGGPTSNTSTTLNYAIQFWTTRGIGVVDVDYGGSTGYGRAYRRQLRDAWGIVDVDDCVAAATWLADQGLVDRDRMVIRGGSAGGYTTLAALAFRDVFAAGASHYGVADLELLAKDTHKFESRYLDRLVGPYPDARDVYVARSPIHHLEGMDRPIILFQGLEDRVVPPEQAQVMADALAERGVPVAHLTFEGEQHGFRQAATITRVITAELAFYGRVLGFTPADRAEPFEIRNEDALAG
jgi:dipeptidyl aminopeptidase/acylaminoacyl peptidase